MANGDRLPWTGASSDERIVFHVDMDCFYAACERLRDPTLEGEPVVVGMGYEADETTGAVATASYEARAFGVESAQPISKALMLLPRRGEETVGRSGGVEEEFDGVEKPTSSEDGPLGWYRPVDMPFYEEVSAQVREILHDAADVVREVSIDEAYLDVTDRTTWREVEGFARKLKHRIVEGVGVPASVGVAPTMSAAKVASDHDKPDGLVVVRPGEVREFLAPLDVDELHGVGPVTARELRDMAIESVGDLASADRGDLVDRFGERGSEFHRFARGEDDRSVTPKGDPKSLSRESAFGEPTNDADVVHDRVKTLALDVSKRASERGATYRTIGIKVVTPPYEVHTRERSLPGPVDDATLVRDVAADLLTEFGGERVRKVGVRVSNLSFADGDQVRLDAWDDPSPKSIDARNGSLMEGTPKKWWRQSSLLDFG